MLLRYNNVLQHIRMLLAYCNTFEFCGQSKRVVPCEVRSKLACQHLVQSRPASRLCRTR